MAPKILSGRHNKTCETCVSYDPITNSKGKCMTKPHLASTGRLKVCTLYSPTLDAHVYPEYTPPKYGPRTKQKPVPEQTSLSHMDYAIAEVQAERDAAVKRIDDKIKVLRAQIHELEESRDSYLVGIDASLDILRKMKGVIPNGTHTGAESST